MAGITLLARYLADAAGVLAQVTLDGLVEDVRTVVTNRALVALAAAVDRILALTAAGGTGGAVDEAGMARRTALAMVSSAQTVGAC